MVKKVSFWTCVTFMLLVRGNMAQSMDSRLEDITSTATRVCQTVPDARGRETDTQVEGNIGAELSGLLKRLLNLGGDASVKVKTTEFQGLTREATALAMQGDRECRVRLIEKLLDAYNSGSLQRDYVTYNTTTDQEIVAEFLSAKLTDGTWTARILGHDIVSTVEFEKSQGTSVKSYANLRDLEDKWEYMKVDNDSIIVTLKCGQGNCVRIEYLDGRFMKYFSQISFEHSTALANADQAQQAFARLVHASGGR